ncbi:glycoside hydrolase family 127 protein [Shewanella mangrovi]|uniref:glycoside hydrolase family 127 protein n=1 Tax=Shewanella mangrovi TaxID=1515746 RepID=UPI00068B621D|nr:glycoside hydrolase family 127 protein [Shewanella mangrovi]
MSRLQAARFGQLVSPLAFAVAMACSTNVAAMELFPLEQVRLTSGSPFAHAQQTNIHYIEQLQPDKLLSPFLREAGLPTKAESYGNWENTGLDGHIGGHYLSALSLAYEATGDAEMKRRLDYMISELRRAQLKNANGYVGGIPGGMQMWADIKAGKIKADLFSLNDHWVPWYNIHKTFAGIRDAYVHGHNELAKVMLVDLGEWAKALVAHLSNEQIQTMLISEHGGMNEVFADMYDITGDKDYLKLAEQFSQKIILDPLLKHEDKLNGLHANTQIPKVIGYLRVSEEEHKQDWHDAAEFFWETVTKHRSVSIGGNSVREHFHDSKDFTSMVEDVEGPETCNTYNMLKLSKILYQESGDSRYLDFYERATFNHILSSQNPDNGGLVYFTAMRPGHYRVYSNVDKSMWCCVGSGIENHSKYGEMIYAHEDNELLINLFIGSTLNWQAQGLTLTQATHFPDQNSMTLTIDKAAGKGKQAISIRVPAWMNGVAPELLLNGKVVKAEQRRAGYLTLERTWHKGDTLAFSFGVKPTLEQLPDGSNYYSVLYGPVVLASKVEPFANEKLQYIADGSRMGHIAAGPTCPPEALPIMVGEPTSFLQGLKRLPGDKLAFEAEQGVREKDEPKKIDLVPFFRIHESRYEVYLPQMSAAKYPEFMAAAKAKEAAAERLAKQTLDKINPGEQQPEAEHNFAGEGSRAGVNKGVHWRDSSDWFAYDLADKQGEANTLRITYFGGDINRTFDILLNDKLLQTVEMKPGHGDNMYQVDYQIPANMVSSNGYRLKFVAKPGSTAGGIYGIRLLKAASK